jgi:hypothetical protein
MLKDSGLGEGYIKKHPVHLNWATTELWKKVKFAKENCTKNVFCVSNKKMFFLRICHFERGYVIVWYIEQFCVQDVQQVTVSLCMTGCIIRSTTYICLSSIWWHTVACVGNTVKQLVDENEMCHTYMVSKQVRLMLLTFWLMHLQIADAS